MSCPVVRTRGAAAFSEAALHVLDMLERGLVCAVSMHLGPDGVGRVSVTTIDGVDVELPGLPDSDDPTDKEP